MIELELARPDRTIFRAVQPNIQTDYLGSIWLTRCALWEPTYVIV